MATDTQAVAEPRAETVQEELNPYRIAQQQFEHASQYLPALSGGLLEFLRRPGRAITLEFPIETQDGEVRNFVGYRVLHNNVRGPGKGGIRYHPDVTLDEVRAVEAGDGLLLKTDLGWLAFWGTPTVPEGAQSAEDLLTGEVTPVGETVTAPAWLER